MEYTKINNNKYNIHFIKTNNFKKNVISLQFREKVTKKNITKRNLLSKVLLKSTKDFKDERELNIRSEELYNVIYSNNVFINGKYSILNCGLTFINPKYTEDTMLNESIDFLFDILLKPDIIDNKFKDENLSLAKEELKEEINLEMESSRAIATKKLYQNMSKDTPLSINHNGYIEDLEKINTKNLYTYYSNVINKNNIDIFVIGDFDQKQITNIIKNKLDFTNEKKSIEDNCLVLKNIKTNPDIINEKSNFNQSILALGFKLDKLTKFEKSYVSEIYSFILGESPESKLFQNVREKNSMCYNINSRIMSSFNIMTITSGIDSKNYNQVVYLIKEELDNMFNGNFSNEDIINAQKSYINDINSSFDTPNNILSLYMFKEYLNKDLIEDRIENIKKVDKKSLIKFAKKIKLDTILLLEGKPTK